MRLGIVYHTPFWRTPHGDLVDFEGSFARYVDSLAPYFDEVSLAVPVRPSGPGDRGYPVRSPNVRVVPLPYFDGPRHFYPRLLAIAAALRRFVSGVDVLHCRVPTPAAFLASLLARRRRIPVFLLVVGDLQAILPAAPYRGTRRWLYTAYVAFEEWALRRMIGRALTFTNGLALFEKHRRDGRAVMPTTTTTIREEDIAERDDTCQTSPVRVLSVTRVDPRKGLTCLPRALQVLGRAGKDVCIDIVGPTVGRPGEAERALVEEESGRLGVVSRLRFLGPMPLHELLPIYREYDIFVLPTGPGEGIPRVLLEAMAAGLPVITSAVAGIPGLIAHEVNGLLLDSASPDEVALAIEALIEDADLRQRLIRNGYTTARAHTLEAQARIIVDAVAAQTGWHPAATKPVRRPDPLRIGRA